MDLFSKQQRRCKHTSAFSRHVAPEFCNFVRPKKQGRREDRVRAAPAVPCKKHGVVATGSPGSTGIPCTMVYGSFVLSPARPGLFATVIPEMLSSQELDTSHWGVRTTRLRRPRTLALVRRKLHVHTCATPLSSGGTARNTQLIWVKNKAEYFSREGWTGFGTREVICPSGSFCRVIHDVSAFPPPSNRDLSRLLISI